MLYLISYDIPADNGGERRRNRLARYLCGLGLRVQWSVFEIEIDPAKLPLVSSEITRLIDPATDSIRIYTLCAACARQVHILGAKAPIENDPLVIW